MTKERHFTTRRGFVGALGFGSLGLYATWAAYGASPLPFGLGTPAGDADSHTGHSENGPNHSAHSDPAMTEAHGASHIYPAEFERRHADFLKRFREADGSIRPVAENESAPAHTDDDTPAAMDMSKPMDMSPPAPPGAGQDEREAHVGHETQPMAHAPAPEARSGHIHAPNAAATDTATQPIEIYFAAGRYAFEPDNLQLKVGQTYRFYMMATDVAHGASIAFGQASRIVRLRPNVVTTLDLTFKEPGAHLIYCTVYCGPGHDTMHARVTVA